jgi:hypothetical protein
MNTSPDVPTPRITPASTPRITPSIISIAPPVTQYECNFCNKKFKHASGLSRHKTEHHSVQRDILKELKQCPERLDCSHLLMHIVAYGELNKYMREGKAHIQGRYASIYDLVKVATIISCDTLEFVKVILDAALTEEIVCNGKLLIALNDFRYTIPLIILDHLGLIREKGINIPHNFLFFKPLNLIGFNTVNLEVAIYVHDIRSTH